MAPPHGCVTRISLDSPVLMRRHDRSRLRYAADLAAQTTSLTTLAGGAISISENDDGSLAVEEVSIVTSDVMASNGVIHFIHQLLPEPEESGDSQ